LEAYGIGEEAIDWIKHYMSGRIQHVSVNGATSSWRNVASGIP
jgi:hypothetical protein